MVSIDFFGLPAACVSFIVSTLASGHSVVEDSVYGWMADSVEVQAIIDAFIAGPGAEDMETAKAQMIDAIEFRGRYFRQAIIDRLQPYATPAEMSMWTEKARQAAIYVATADASQAPDLKAEADYSGQSLSLIVARVSANAARLSGFEANIAGNVTMHKTAVKALAAQPLSVAAVAAVLEYDYSEGWPEVP